MATQLWLRTCKATKLATHTISHARTNTTFAQRIVTAGVKAWVAAGGPAAAAARLIDTPVLDIPHPLDMSDLQLPPVQPYVACGFVPASYCARLWAVCRIVESE